MKICEFHKMTAATLLKVIFIVALATNSLCNIGGLTYMDPMNYEPLPTPRGEDPCNPLYWYPKEIPEYCYIKMETPQPPVAIPQPVPVPIPVPAPAIVVPAPLPLMPPSRRMEPAELPAPVPLGSPPPGPPPKGKPISILPPPPLPYGVPIAPTNPMLPVAGIPYSQVPPPYPYPQFPPGPYPDPYALQRPGLGMVPGIPGIVSRDGGINVLPFSDAYSDILEKRKNKLLRRRLKKVLEDYEDYPRWRRRRRRRHRSRMFE